MKVSNLLKTAGGVVTVGGIAGEYLLTGEYKPANWIAPGAYLWTLGDGLDTFGTAMKEYADEGTKTKYVGKGAKILSAGGLGTYSLLNTGENPMGLLTPIGLSSLVYLGGIYLDNLGNKIKEKISPPFQLAKEFKKIYKELKNEKKIKKKLEKFQESDLEHLQKRFGELNTKIEDYIKEYKNKK